MTSGSIITFTNGLQTGRCGDPVSCGSNVATCSTDTFVGDILSVVFKPGYSEVDYGNLDDDPDTDDGYSVFPPIVGTPTPVQIARSIVLDVSPTTIVSFTTDSTSYNDSTAIVDCSGIPDNVPIDLQLTTNFNLLTLTTEAAISDYTLISQQTLTKKQITCNLLSWCENIGEPLLTEYGAFVITSAFRHGSTISQHERGQAVDVQFPSLTNEQIYNICIWIKDNLAYDQLILEYGGNKPWIHISYNKEGNRVETSIHKFGTRVSAGVYEWKKLINMV